MDRPVTQFMTKDVIALPANKTVKDAIELMRKYDISSVVIVDPEDHHKPIGLKTSYDLLELFLSQSNGSALDIPLKKYIKDLLSLNEEATMGDAAKMFLDYQIHHIVILSHEGELAGILSTLDLAKAFKSKN